jgi:hypothetical protein
MSRRSNVMIELTEQQRQELDAEAPRAIDPLTRRVYVLVREDVFDRVRDLLVPERLTAQEQRSALRAAGLRAGWDDPEMDVYDEGPSPQRHRRGIGGGGIA